MLFCMFHAVQGRDFRAFYPKTQCKKFVNVFGENNFKINACICQLVLTFNACDLCVYWPKTE